ncbi:MAG: TonB-dependent receptor [Pseudomonadota bacterium]
MTDKHLKPIIFLILAILAAASPAAAHDRNEDTTAQAIDTIVVTATKTEMNVDDAPGKVTVITREDLAQLDIKTVDEVLASLSGIFAKRTKGLMDSTPSVSIRGFKGDQYTLILLDGQPLNDAYGGSIEWGTLPVSNIERIEVLRGAASALYGGNAMGGVIHIITKTPKKLEMEATAGSGTNNTKRYRVGVGNRVWDRLSFRVGYEQETTDGYPTTPVVRSITSGDGNVTGGYPMDDKTGESTQWVVGDKGDNGGERSSVDGKLSLDFSDTGNVSLTAVSARHEYNYSPPHTYMDSFGDSTTYAVAGEDLRARFQPNDFISSTGIGRNETDTVTASASELLGTVKVQGQVGTVRSDDRYTLETGSGSQDYTDSPGSLKITENTTWFSELRGTMPLGKSHLLTAGGTFRSDTSDTDDYSVPFYRSYDGKGDSTFYSGGDSRNWGAFIQDEWMIAAPLTLYLGLRYDSWKVDNGASGVPGSLTDYPSNIESAVNPKVAMVYKPYGNTTLRASAGHAFRAPTLYELYRSYSSGSTTYQSNPYLEPETSWGYELGVDQYLFNRKTRLSVTGFWNDIEDLIYYRVKGSTKTRDNAGTARSYGLEVEASQAVTNWLTLWGNFTWTDAEITDNPTDPSSENKQISGIPEIAWNAGMDLKWEKVRGSLVGRYYSKLEEDTKNGVYGTYEPALFVDAKVTVTPTPWLDLTLSVDNILDEEYYEYYRTDGRTFLVELTLRY